MMNFDVEKDWALQAISNYYEPRKALRLQKALDSAARYINNPALVLKLRLYTAICRADAVLICELLTLLPKAKQQFFQARYRDKVPITFLAPKLYLSPKQLVSWNNDLCGLLSDLLNARVTEKVLSADKLRLAQNHLNSVLAVVADNGGAFDSLYIQELQRRKERIEDTLVKIAAYLQSVQNPIERAVLADWTRDSSLTYVELAYGHRISEASARRYILQYKAKVLPG